MNAVISSEATSLATLWPLAVLAMLVGSLSGVAFHRADRPSRRAAEPAWAGTGPAVGCGSVGHHYVRRETGWCCPRCGDEIRDQIYLPLTDDVRLSGVAPAR
ncbi:hypothetical protein [Terrabacter sp. MAHUQ-38]|jgi:hypothetical protein|uniref:hypothetical protein n=1 Tax=unclassified Terrabacter TaxID=2630222 RepID=UPI00165E30AA|nr:hypothetical protein [Terrabacter sp. MAHUQ-38]MBC9824053.1 hypothetical protein [Terrabacter sp. MAHUQ-38]